MKTKKPKNLKFNAPKYNDLFAAVSQHGGELHKGFWDMMIEAGFSKKQMAYRFTELLLGMNSVNKKILKTANFEK